MYSIYEQSRLTTHKGYKMNNQTITLKAFKELAINNKSAFLGSSYTATLEKYISLLDEQLENLNIVYNRTGIAKGNKIKFHYLDENNMPSVSNLVLSGKAYKYNDNTFIINTNDNCVLAYSFQLN